MKSPIIQIWRKEAYFSEDLSTSRITQKKKRCVKGVRIPVFPGLFFPELGHQKTSVNLHMGQSIHFISLHIF